MGTKVGECVLKITFLNVFETKEQVIGLLSVISHTESEKSDFTGDFLGNNINKHNGRKISTELHCFVL